MDTHHLEERLFTLTNILKSMDSVLVAYSGGVDSSFLLAMAVETLGVDRVLAVTATSEVIKPEEMEQADKIATFIGARHIIIKSPEMNDVSFTSNSPERCYYCKKILYTGLFKVRDDYGLKHIADGSNLDDDGDYRPGLKALSELGVISPLKNALLTKQDIRAAARQMGLPNWDTPSQACLASRIPYGTSIDRKKLLQVYNSEKYLNDLGFKSVRVRYYSDIARIEVPEDELNDILMLREDILRYLKRQGFTYVTVDIQGIRSGSMNEVLNR